MTSAPAGTFQPRPTRADGLPVRVLVVDDEPNLAELLTSALRLEGMDVTAALDGASALRAVRESVPDIVVLDIMLPDMDGLTVLSRLREHGERVPVLFLTARCAGRARRRRTATACCPWATWRSTRTRTRCGARARRST